MERRGCMRRPASSHLASLLRGGSETNSTQVMIQPQSVWSASSQVSMTSYATGVLTLTLSSDTLSDSAKPFLVLVLGLFCFW